MEGCWVEGCCYCGDEDRANHKAADRIPGRVVAAGLEPLLVAVFVQVSWAVELEVQLEVELEAAAVLELHTMLSFPPDDVQIHLPSPSRRINARRQETKRR